MLNVESYVDGFFDDIVCINLRHREDRRKHMIRVMAELGIPFRFVVFDKSPKGGIYGCFESHMKVLKDSYDSGCQRVLIFEDDIIPTPGYSPEKMKLGVDFMRSNDWDLFYYGYGSFNDKFISVLTSAPTQSEHIVQYKPLMTHAYAVNRKTMKHVLDIYRDYIGKIHLDQFYVNHTVIKSFCMVPMLFEQHLCSQNDNQIIDAKEAVFRANMCLTEKCKVNYRVSWLKWFTNTWVFTVVLLLLVTILSVIIFMSLSHS